MPADRRRINRRSRYVALRHGNMDGLPIAVINLSLVTNGVECVTYAQQAWRGGVCAPGRREVDHGFCLRRRRGEH